MSSRIGWILLVALCGGWDLGKMANPDVARGNELWKQGDAGGAAEAYRRALRARPDDPAVHFNLGTALFRQAEQAGPADRDRLLEEAEREFRLGTDASDARLKSDATYNLGNTFLARERLADAIEEYKKTLRLNAAHEKARKNLELALRKKKQQEQPPPPQQQDQRQQQQQDQQQQQQQDQQQQQQQDQQQQQQQQQDQQQQDQQQQPQTGDERPQQQPPQQQQPSPDDQQRPGAQQRPQPGEEGERSARPVDPSEWKLDALERMSKELQVKKQRAKVRDQRLGAPRKDW